MTLDIHKRVQLVKLQKLFFNNEFLIIINYNNLTTLELGNLRQYLFFHNYNVKVINNNFAKCILRETFFENLIPLFKTPTLVISKQKLFDTDFSNFKKILSLVFTSVKIRPQRLLLLAIIIQKKIYTFNKLNLFSELINKKKIFKKIFFLFYEYKINLKFFLINILKIMVILLISWKKLILKN